MNVMIRLAKSISRNARATFGGSSVVPANWSGTEACLSRSNFAASLLKNSDHEAMPYRPRGFLRA